MTFKMPYWARFAIDKKDEDPLVYRTRAQMEHGYTLHGCEHDIKCKIVNSYLIPIKE